MTRAEEVVYLGKPPDQTFAVLHATTSHCAVAIVLCPPFGWEDVTSYRVRRGWANHLADQGVACLRLTLPGTGDSGGHPRDLQRVRAWTTAIDDAARYLRDCTGAPRIVALGLGLGGLLACQAAADSRGVDGIILWAAPPRGVDAVRQLKAFGRLERSTFWTDGISRSALHPGEMEAGGFMLSAETVQDLEMIDVEQLDLEGALPDGALLLDRDGIEVDERWFKSLGRASIRLDHAPGNGYAEMTSHPQTADMPMAVLTIVDQWLAQLQKVAFAGRSALAATPVVTDRKLQFNSDGRATETAITVDVDGVQLRGIHTVPEHGTTDLAVIFLNAGAQRRIGPNRMWVEASRRWAGLGVSSVRLDVQGIGDSDGELAPYRANRTLNTSERVEQVVRAIRELRSLGVADRFMLVGLCGGAYWAFHALLLEPSVCAAVPINPYAIVWSDQLAPSRDLRRIFTERSWALIRKNATPARVRALGRWLALTPVRQAEKLRRLRPGSIQPSETEFLNRAMASKKGLTFIFSEREPLLDEFRRTERLTEFARLDAVRVHPLRVNDHTLRPSWAQREVHRLLDEALAAELVTTPGNRASAAPQAKLG